MENTLFETEEGFFTALNGVYAELPQASLYGKSLAASRSTCRPSISIPRSLRPILSTRWAPTPRRPARRPSPIRGTKPISSSPTSTRFSNIASDRDVLSDRAYHIIRGEMLGMRALLHFEMLRIFGPVFAEAPARVSIPYRTSSERPSRRCCPRTRWPKRSPGTSPTRSPNSLTGTRAHRGGG